MVNNKKEYNREYYLRNKEKFLIAVKKWQEFNKEKIKAYRKEYNSRPEIKEKTKNRTNKYYHTNIARKEYILNKNKLYRKNPEYKKREYVLGRTRVDNDINKRLYRRKYTNEYYKKTKEIRRKIRMKSYYFNKKKELARSIASHIPMKEHCENCGVKENLERHHYDYDLPKEFITLCSICHGKIHRKITTI